MKTPDLLFDEPDPAEMSAEAPAEAPAVSAPAAKWQEVPQALFLSWPPKKQLAYCARRDDAFAAMEPDQADFYHRRAAAYRAQQPTLPTAPQENC